jgi:hypothetical protein
VSIDPRLEHIFEAWFDYDHATDEDAKLHSRQRRASLILTALESLKSEGTVGDFLHIFRDDYREWSIRKQLSAPRRRF